MTYIVFGFSYNNLTQLTNILWISSPYLPNIPQLFQLSFFRDYKDNSLCYKG